VRMIMCFDDVFLGKWATCIAVVLSDGNEHRFNEFLKFIPEITNSALSKKLKQMEEKGLVRRIVHDETPVRVGYVFTEKGMDSAKMIDSILDWMDKYGPEDLRIIPSTCNGSGGT
ncbi:MAG: winged helix-turn-helix transcriptional regulator, partial [Candidatus Methanomethylophilaceae archaeon]